MSWFLGRKASREKYEVGKETRVSSTLDFIHSDVSGPMPTTSMNGSIYFITFIDDCSSYCWIYFLKQKYDIFETFKVFKDLVENDLGKKIKSIISNNGGEYVKKYFQQLCVSKGIKMEQLVPYTPQ